MYFENKFNPEVQRLIKEQEWGGSTTIGEFDNEAFFKQATVDINNPRQRPAFTKIIPLLLYTRLESNNIKDVCFNNKALICENDPSTVINCWYEDENIIADEEDEEVIE